MDICCAVGERTLKEGFFIKDGLSNVVPEAVVGVLGSSEMVAALMEERVVGAVAVAEAEAEAEAGIVMESELGPEMDAVEEDVGGGIGSDGLVKVAVESDSFPGRGDGWIMRFDSDSFHALRRASLDSKALPFWNRRRDALEAMGTLYMRISLSVSSNVSLSSS